MALKYGDRQGLVLFFAISSHTTNASSFLTHSCLLPSLGLLYFPSDTFDSFTLSSFSSCRSDRLYFSFLSSLNLNWVCFSPPLSAQWICLPSYLKNCSLDLWMGVGAHTTRPHPSPTFPFCSWRCSFLAVHPIAQHLSSLTLCVVKLFSFVMLFMIVLLDNFFGIWIWPARISLFSWCSPEKCNSFWCRYGRSTISKGFFFFVKETAESYKYVFSYRCFRCFRC